MLLLFCVDLLLEDSDYIVDMFLEDMDDFDFYIGIWEGWGWMRMLGFWGSFWNFLVDVVFMC